MIHQIKGALRYYMIPALKDTWKTCISFPFKHTQFKNHFSKLKII